MTTVHIVNAFSDNGQGGNPAGVVLNAEHLGHAERQAIAAQIGVSETAFVSRREEHVRWGMQSAWQMEFFTPTRQIVNCGHATIAALHMLKEHGMAGDGPLSLHIGAFERTGHLEWDRAYLEVAREKPAESVTDDFVEAAWKALGRDLERDGLPNMDGQVAVVASAGNPFLLLPYTWAEDLAAIKPDMAQIRALSEQAGVVGFYVYTPNYDQHNKQMLAEARMFAPGYGIDEEAATGMAAAALVAGYEGLGGEKEAFIRQGHLMSKPRQSAIYVKQMKKEWFEPRRYAVGGLATYDRAVELPSLAL